MMVVSCHGLSECPERQLSDPANSDFQPNATRHASRRLRTSCGLTGAVLRTGETIVDDSYTWPTAQIKEAWARWTVN